MITKEIRNTRKWGDVMGIPENIDALLVKYDITQDFLAHIAGVSPSSVTGWRKGSTPRKYAIDKICNYFNITEDDILSDKYGIAAKEHNKYLPIPEGAKSPDASFEAYAPLLGKVHAGEAQEPDIMSEQVQVPYSVKANHPHGYLLKVEGDCMNKVYPEGCLIYIDPDKEPTNGSIAVASIDGSDYVMRRIYKGVSAIVLSPDSFNDAYDDIVVTSSDDTTVELAGTVVWFQPEKELE